MRPFLTRGYHRYEEWFGNGNITVKSIHIFSGMSPYASLVSVLLLVMESYGLCSVLLRTTICNTLQVISHFRETLSMDTTICTHDIYGPRSDGHGFW